MPREPYHIPQEGPPSETAVLVGVHLLPHRPGAASEFCDLDELERLADTAGAQVAGRVEQRRVAPDVRSLMGWGKAEELKGICEALHADLIIFDNDLTPAQGRNLEKLLERRVIDRTELILDIFARHARTRQARLQVELAQYQYLLPRLTRMWKHLERQAGGIGTRGPGEAQIETDRRIIRRRIGQLRRELKSIDRRAEVQAKQRRREFRVALVGYTNAGKSSLMNRLTDAGVYVEDQLFATLDATTRRVELDEGHAFLLSDTVGFIRKLPHHLVESFRATLSEVSDADLLFHVVDAAAEDVEGQIEAVEQVLDRVHPQPRSTLMILNKIDLLADDRRREELTQRYPQAVMTSARDGRGVQDLCEEILRLLRRQERRLLLRIESDAPRTLAQLYELGEVLEVEYLADHARVRVSVGGANYGRMVQLPGLRILEVVSRGNAG